jgi:hypothetical protein
MSYSAGGREREPQSLSREEVAAWRRRAARNRAARADVLAPRVFLLTIAVVLVIWLAYLLSAALLTVGGEIPGLTVETASAATPLSCATPTCGSSTPQDFEYSAPANSWAVVGVRSTGATGNANVCIHDDAALTQTFACSDLATNGAVDFVVVDYHHRAASVDYVRTTRAAGSGEVCTTFDCGTTTMTAGTSVNATWPSNGVVRAFNLRVAAGTYRVGLAVTSGTADLGLAVFNSAGQAGYAAGRSGALVEADAHASGQGEGLYFTSTGSDTFGLVVWSNTAAGTANYRVEFRLAEQLVANTSSDESGTAAADFLYVPTEPRGWSVVALRPAVGNPAPDADLKLYTGPDYLSQIKRSSAEPGIVDFIVADYANVPEDTAAVLMVSLGPLGNYKLQWIYDPPSIAPGEPAGVTVGSHVGLAWRANLLAGVEYLWRFLPNPGTRGDASLGLYGPKTSAPEFTYGTRVDSLAGSDVWAESASGWIADQGVETFLYTPQVSGEFLLFLYQKRTQAVTGSLVHFPTSLIGVPAPGPGRATFAAPWPSPTRTGQSVRFAFEGGAGTPARLVVHDARGRTVRVLLDGPLAGGSTVLAWDGRLAGGAEAPAGLYFARLERAGLAVEVRRFVRLD